tara:strand:- start:102 stop:425 length:324 start_codon:yes stop_codon:yes gene_type:complete
MKKGKSKKENLAKSWGEWIRNHPQTPSLLQKVFDTAMMDGDDNQWKAINVLIDRIAPHLKSVEMDVKGEISQGVIVLPEKKTKTAPRRPTQVDKVAEEVIKDISAEA